jgi:hypothetical protein
MEGMERIEGGSKITAHATRVLGNHASQLGWFMSWILVISS